MKDVSKNLRNLQFLHYQGCVIQNFKSRQHYFDLPGLIITLIFYTLLIKLYSSLAELLTMEGNIF